MACGSCRFVPVATQQRLWVRWCTARLQVELTSSLLTPPVGWTTRSCVPGVANTATPARRASGEPPRHLFPGFLRQSELRPRPSPRSAHPSPGDASLVARPPSRPGGCLGAGLQNRCIHVLSQSQSDCQVKANNVTEAKTVLIVNSF